MLEFPSCAFMRRAMSSLDGVAGCAAACLALTVCAAAHAGAKSWSIDSAAHQTSSRHAFLVRSRSVSSLTAAASVGRIATTLVTSTPAFDIPTTGAIVGDEILVIANYHVDRLRPDGSIQDRDTVRPAAIVAVPLGRSRGGLSGGTQSDGRPAAAAPAPLTPVISR